MYVQNQERENFQTAVERWGAPKALKAVKLLATMNAMAAWISLTSFLVDIYRSTTFPKTTNSLFLAGNQKSFFCSV